MEPIYRGSCAATAGCVGQLFTYPIDVVRAQLTVNPGKYKGVISAGKSIAKEGGTFALYRGLAPTLLAVTPFLAFQMSTADAIKSIMSEKGIELTTPRMMLVGGTAGVVAQSFVYPLDVLRRRMQVGGSVGSVGNAAVLVSYIYIYIYIFMDAAVDFERFDLIVSGWICLLVHCFNL